MLTLNNFYQPEILEKIIQSFKPLIALLLEITDSCLAKVTTLSMYIYQNLITCQSVLILGCDDSWSPCDLKILVVCFLFLVMLPRVDVECMVSEDYVNLVTASM